MFSISFSFLFLRGLVIVQSSGIETLVEELCSKLKDLQSKQGEEKNVYTSEAMYCIYQLCNILRWGGYGGVGCFSVAFTCHAILKYFWIISFSNLSNFVLACFIYLRNSQSQMEFSSWKTVTVHIQLCLLF